MKFYAKVILPIFLPKAYSYSIPEQWVEQIQIGSRVVVSIKGKKQYTGLVCELTDEKPELVEPIDILDLIDETPYLKDVHIKFWQWIAEYYMCTLGEVMLASMISALRPSSESNIILSPFFDENQNLNDKEYLVVESLRNHKELSIVDVQKLLVQKNVQKVIISLLEKKIIYLKEQLKRVYKPKQMDFVDWNPKFKNALSNDELGTEMFDLVKSAPKQELLLLSFISLYKNKSLPKSDFLKDSNATLASLKGLEKKEILQINTSQISRLDQATATNTERELSAKQKEAKSEIDNYFNDNKIVLLHGVTGSGKTQIYIELIKETIKKGKQALFLLPEVGLTNQMIKRLETVFGEDIQVYHSRLNDHKRVEIWKSATGTKKIFVGSRSTLFLPFNDLGLVIVDESHDPSYKQSEKSPFYNGRDAAIYLARMMKANVILGSATPSVDSYYHAKNEKYGLVELKERYGLAKMPTIKLIDKSLEQKHKRLKNSYSQYLLNAIEETIANKQQVLIFQNKRGYTSTVYCSSCGWVAKCNNCDVSLTYHKFYGELKCHLCSSRHRNVNECPACSSRTLFTKGLGTEKVEGELQIYFPDATIKRLDSDTSRSNTKFNKLIYDFENGSIDILVGTQMITKGLDFKNVGLVGVISAESLLFYPDPRAIERTFQTLTQVAGRAGRREKRGSVIIQTFNNHVVLDDVKNENYNQFFKRECQERQSLQYPPFVRLIHLTIKSKDRKKAQYGADFLVNFMKPYLKDRIQGPATPKVTYVRTFHLKNILIKMPRNAEFITKTKNLILTAKENLYQVQGMKSVRVVVDVDPYYI